MSHIGHQFKQKQFHEAYRCREGAPLITIEQVRRSELQPCYTTGSDRYSDNKMEFHKILEQHGGWQGKYVLDYGCGSGLWTTYMSMTGAKKVVGVDICESGVRLGRERLVQQGLTDKAELNVMDVTKMSFPDNEFDMVFGNAILHHIINYPNVFEELHRVMKPGSQAFFLEGLADFAPYKWYWKRKGWVDAGDMPIFRKVVLEKAQMFHDVQVIGDNFLYSIKRFLWQPNMGFGRKTILRGAKCMDTVLFCVCPLLRRWGSFSYLIFTK